jgi:hypothetical protein
MGDVATKGLQALRADHDQLAGRLAERASVDEARRALLLFFLGLVAGGISLALIWDRYAELPSKAARAHPGPFVAGFVALGAMAVCLLVLGGMVSFRARRTARDEAALLERLHELRRALGMEP